jgi:hypothetical protein
MVKMKRLLRNGYRIFLVRPNGRRSEVYCNELFSGPEKDSLSDSSIRRIIASDELSFDVDPELRNALRQRVRDNKLPFTPSWNSLLEMFLPLFSLKQIELKMTVISLVLFIMVGMGPANKQASNRNFNLFFLADTLKDTMVLHIPALEDRAGRIQVK